MRLEFVYAKPTCSWSNPLQTLSFLERWQGEDTISSNDLSSLLTLAAWQTARERFEADTPKKWQSVLLACWRRGRERWPRISQGWSLQLCPGMGKPGLLVAQGPYKEAKICSAVPEATALIPALKLLEEGRNLPRRGFLLVTRGSGPAAVESQRMQWPKALVCRCSASSGAGLATHLPLLRRAVGIAELVFPSRERLGRSGWRGTYRVFRAAGLAVSFLSAERGCDAAGRSNSLSRLATGSRLASCVLIPAKLGIGKQLGRVCIVAGPAALSLRCAKAVAPSDDIRVEHLLLEAALLGISAPIRLLPPVSGLTSE